MQKKLYLNKRTIMRLNSDMMVWLNGAVTTDECGNTSGRPMTCDPQSKIVNNQTHCIPDDPMK